jgi:hypothetical protein
MKTLIQRIQENDPRYDPWAEAVAASGHTRELADAAMSRVVLDGNYGPLSDSDWEEQDGRKPYSVAEALDILSDISDCIDDYREFVYVGTDPETDEPLEEEQTTATAEDIRRCVFRSVIEIYGGLPW